MGFDIDSEFARKCYEDACRRLEELKQKREECRRMGLSTHQIDYLIIKSIEIRDGCAYYCNE